MLATAIPASLSIARSIINEEVAGGELEIICRKYASGKIMVYIPEGLYAAVLDKQAYIIAIYP